MTEAIGAAPPGDPPRPAFYQDPVKLAVALGLIFLAALALRLYTDYQLRPTYLLNDEIDYYTRAMDLAQKGEIHTGWRGVGGRPPLSGWHYALWMSFLGPNVEAARIGNTLLGSLTVLLLFYIALKLGGPKAGLIAAALGAFYPQFIAYSASLWNETIFIFLSLSAVSFAISFYLHNGTWKLCAMGALLGLCALTREVGLSLFVFLLLWFLVVYRSGIKKKLLMGAVLAVSFAAVVAPWSIYINRFHDYPVLLTNTTHLNLYITNGFNKNTYKRLGKTNTERDLNAKKKAMDRIAKEMPWWPFKKAIEVVPRFLTPNSYPYCRVLTKPVGATPYGYRFNSEVFYNKAVRYSLAAWLAVSYIIVMVIGAAGLMLIKEVRLKLLLVAFYLGILVPSIITLGASRYRLPTMPVIMLGASYLLAHGAGLWRSSSLKLRLAAVGAALLVLAIMALRWHELTHPVWS